MGGGAGKRRRAVCMQDYSVVCSFCKGSCDHFPFATNPKKMCLIDTGDDEEGTDGNRGSSS